MKEEKIDTFLRLYSAIDDRIEESSSIPTTSFQATDESEPPTVEPPVITSSCFDDNESCGVQPCTVAQVGSVSVPLEVAAAEVGQHSSSGDMENSDIVREDVKDALVNIDLQEILQDPYPSDRGHYHQNELDPKVKKFIMRCGPCRPEGPFPNDENNRSFSTYYYTTKNKGGVSIQRQWMCYSPKLNHCYCEPCWLFGDRSRMKFSKWIDGTSDWQNLSTKIKRHENSATHLESCAVYDSWKKNETLDKNLESQIRNEESYWRKVLYRLIDIVCFLAKQNLAFREHRESLRSGQMKAGNFLALVELMAKYDPVLKELVSKPEGTTKYLHHDIQNEFISIISEHIKKSLLEDIRNSPFYSMILDSTPDISNTDQLSIVIRYVKIIKDCEGNPKDLKVEESFLEFVEMHDHSALGLKNKVIEFFEKHSIDIKKCRGQGYDGASVMSGGLGGLQALISTQAKYAKFIHCAAHRLNLVMNDAVKSLTQVSEFFDTVQHLYTFFHTSCKRWESLEEGQVSFGAKNLKRLCPTRWSSRDDALQAIRSKYVDVMKALTEIILKSKKKEEVSVSNGLKKKIGTFDFVFLLVMFSKIFGIVTPLSKYLQSKSIDIKNAEVYLENAYEKLKSLRNSYDEMKIEANRLAQSWGIEPKFERKRNRWVKKHFDELSQDERIQNAEERFRVGVYLPVIDILCNRLQERFKSFKDIVSLFHVLSPKVLSEASDHELTELSARLMKEYSEDLSDDFPRQMVSFRTILRRQLENMKDIREVGTALICEHSTLSTSYPDVCAAYLLFLTLPVTSASAERSFSKLKLIKSYLRSTMSQERLTGLSTISIESETLQEISLDAIINTFAAAKSRKVKL